MNELENKSFVPITIGNTNINYNSDKHEISIKNNRLKPLSINFDGELILSTSKGLQIVSTGQVDIVTNDKLICLDSVNSFIHLNSRKSKLTEHLRKSNLNKRIDHQQQKLLEQKRMEQDKKISEFSELIDIIDNLNDRLRALELKEEKTINIKN